MSLLLSEDPGIRVCGVAVFKAGELQVAGLVKNRAESGAGPAEAALMAQAIATWFVEHVGETGMLDELALEWPQTYGGRASKGDANDLLPLAGVDTALCAIFSKARTSYYVPHAWKGSIDGDAMIERIKGRLTAAETARVVLPTAKSLHHNVWDGIGVGLFKVGRLAPRRVFASE